MGNHRDLWVHLHFWYLSNAGSALTIISSHSSLNVITAIMTISTATASPSGAALNKRRTIAYYAMFIALGLAVAALGPTLPGLAANTHSTLSAISILFTMQALGSLIGSLSSGRWYDRAPAHIFLAGVIIVLALMLALMPLMTTITVLALIVFVIGMAGGSIDVGGNTLLIWLFKDGVGPYMNALHFFFGVGALLSPLFIARVIALGGGITGAYWLLASLLIPAVLLLLRLPSPRIPYQTDGDAATHPRWLLVFLIAAMFFFFVGAELSYGGWIYTYALSLGLATITTAGYLTSLFWGALTLGRLVNIPVAARVRPRYMLMADIGGLALSLLLLLFWPASTSIIWIATFGMGFAMASAFATLMGLGEHHIAVTGKITSLFFVGSSLGSMTIPWLIGQFFEPYGAQSMILWIMATVLAAAVTLAIFLWMIRTESPTKIEHHNIG